MERDCGDLKLRTYFMSLDSEPDGQGEDFFVKKGRQYSFADDRAFVRVFRYGADYETQNTDY
ncbi:MAG: hypothetical protein HFI57_09600 [Lachnospiraceae bacterium]|nr:hypothetical protein [Lachnospiraceae bacterium]